MADDSEAIEQVKEAIRQPFQRSAHERSAQDDLPAQLRQRLQKARQDAARDDTPTQVRKKQKGKAFTAAIRSRLAALRQRKQDATPAPEAPKAVRSATEDVQYHPDAPQSKRAKAEPSTVSAGDFVVDWSTTEEGRPFCQVFLVGAQRSTELSFDKLPE